MPDRPQRPRPKTPTPFVPHVRPLKTRDAFAFVRILRKLDLKLEMPKLTPEILKDEAKLTEAQTEAGGRFFLDLILNIGAAEPEVSAFLADLAGMTPEAFADLPLEDGFAVLAAIGRLPGLRRFLALLGRLTSTTSSTSSSPATAETASSTS
jgi:hypothetical protein